MRTIAIPEVVEQLVRLGVRTGGVLLVHTSYRAVGPVENGPSGLLAALLAALGPDGTLTMPSWPADDSHPFDPSRTPAAPDLGATADAFWRLPGARRSAHPQAFAALGPAAGRIVADPLPLPPHIAASPVGRVHDLDGQVLLLGVGHDADTTLHLAEVMADVPYGIPRTCTAWEGGQPVRLDYRENDHCCQRFALADDWLRAEGLQAEGVVGHAPARLARSRDIVRLARARLASDPLLFLHDDAAGCDECNAARESIQA